MLGRAVAHAIETRSAAAIVHPAVIDAVADHDLFFLNLECCISTRGERWPDPRKPFFFRAPPAAVEVLTRLGVDCVTLANNHALDYGYEALLDTIDHLTTAGIAVVGAGEDLASARRPRTLEAGGTRLTDVAFSEPPPDFAAGPEAPGMAYAEPAGGVPGSVQLAVVETADPGVGT